MASGTALRVQPCRRRALSHRNGKQRPEVSSVGSRPQRLTATLGIGLRPIFRAVSLLKAAGQLVRSQA